MFKRLFISTIFSLLTTLSAYASVSYTFDKNHTYALWRVSHFGFSEITGKVFATGTLQYDKDKPELSQATVTVDIQSMTTGISKLDRELVGKEYFDAEKFPTATFVSKSIKKTGKYTGSVSGILTIKNISKPVVLAVQLQKNGMHPLFNRDTLGFKATTEIVRSDFGLRNYLPGVGDKIEIEIQTEAALTPTDKTTK